MDHNFPFLVKSCGHVKCVLHYSITMVVIMGVIMGFGGLLWVLGGYYGFCVIFYKD